MSNNMTNFYLFLPIELFTEKFEEQSTQFNISYDCVEEFLNFEKNFKNNNVSGSIFPNP